MNKKKKQYYFELMDVFHFIFKWRKKLIIICSVSAILSILVSSPWIIRPKYKSTAVFYPSMNNSISSALLTDSRVKQKDPLEFGEQVAAQQYVQILESDYLKGKVIKRYNLLENYRIDPEDSEKNYKLGKQYDKNISVKKTPYASIEISVLDEKPEVAAEVANGIVMILDSVKTEVQRKLAMQALYIIETEYKRKEEEIVVEDEGREHTVPMSEFTKIFNIAFCITVHKSQGQTFDEAYTIHEFNQYDERLKYVALSRATDINLINII
jgi:capsular polysaccharide biosynthesis protein